MPTYEYRCKDCGHTFDAYQSFTDDALTECPECSGALKKVFGSVGISFKGSGFYKTDSRSGSTAATAGSSNGDGAKKDAASSDGAATTDTPKATPRKEASTSSSSGSSTSSD
ncbi:FmdB family transcriptional regulator [Iamia sp. SCSIO 61187]|uniref:FmdB family zinc ribbon protein n=1 Tax=Iamia sp. SCSIO 61187 TaxID=2722752 RepID=UPI001C6336D2|nr:FmdB family zinc ribbon protein [Iamia sp. SCSIO 61187]QYG93893.1 FmdB family transcriptional regulator [Iamia sp. SCSIO 61187]